MPANTKLLAVILGGGAGNRLFPLTQQRSKPAVPLGGKYRLVDIALSNCINSDILRTFVLTQYNSASLNRHIAQTYRFSQFSNGFVEIIAAEQTPESPQWFQGTADAVRQVLPHIRDWGIDTLLILSGDHLYRMDYRQFLERHHDTGADVTVSVIPCEAGPASEFGLLKTDENGRIVEFKEKPKGDELRAMQVDTTRLGLDAKEAARRPFLASMGIYVFKYDHLEQLLAEDPTAVDFGKHIIPAAINSARNVQAHMFDGYWEDIGTIGAFYRANLDLTTKIPKFNLFDAEAPVYTRARYLPPSKIEETEVNDSILSDGCIINGAKITNSVVGLRSRISKGVQLDASFMMGADFYQTFEEMGSDMRKGMPRVGIGEGSVVRRAIIDKNARIGKNAKLLNEAGVSEVDGPGGSYFIRDGIIIVPKNAVIPDGSIV
ncbi:MAG TPA: glucose-1-phosphate adenylyltransferase [Pyrinomonadaceae bacterium]|jgi:glucose-1-phosphate adenylyltransferase|nr:glucose-1-phosphate adenylyltransferase [Pyrinomonadaceae bacterium]